MTRIPSLPPLGRRAALALLLAGGVAGCGFRLRGAQNFVFSSIAVTSSDDSAIAPELRRSFGSGVRVLAPGAPPAQAQVVLQVLSEQPEKSVVGLNASGQVREFQLRLRVGFALSTPQGRELMAADEIVLRRDISYNESAALAKEAEEAMLLRDMQTDIVQQILRRLAALKSLG